MEEGNMLAAVIAFLPAFYVGNQSGSAFTGFGEGAVVFFCAYAAFILSTYAYTHYVLRTYVHLSGTSLIFGFLNGDKVKAMLMQIFVPSIVGWGIALIIIL